MPTHFGNIGRPLHPGNIGKHKAFRIKENGYFDTKILLIPFEGDMIEIQKKNIYFRKS